MSSDMWCRFAQLVASDISKALFSGQKSGTINCMAECDFAQELTLNSQLIRLIRESFILECVVKALNNASWKLSSVFQITAR